MITSDIKILSNKIHNKRLSNNIVDFLENFNHINIDNFGGGNSLYLESRLRLMYKFSKGTLLIKELFYDKI